MDKKELKELKHGYKSALLLGDDSAEFEAKLKAELGPAWDDFAGQVETFLVDARKLGEKAFKLACDGMAESALGDCLKRAKALGGGAQKYVMESYRNGREVREEHIWQQTMAKKKELKAQAERSKLEAAKAEEMVKKVETPPVAQVVEETSPKPKPEAASEPSPEPAKVPEPVKAPPPKAAAKPVGTASPLIPELPSEQLGPKPNPNALRVLSTHPNDITTLPESNHWTICIDESYHGKKENVFNAFSTNGLGVMAGVVFSDENPLPKLGRQHCCDGRTEKTVETLDIILQHKGCGVLALPANSLLTALGWQDVLIELVNVILRLIPFPEDDSKVHVKICVEPYNGLDNKENFRPVEETCKKVLKDSFPERAERMVLDFEPMPKPELGSDAVSHNAYPDLVANTCRMKDDSTVAGKLYDKTHWGGVCFLNEEPKSVARILRYFDRQEPLDELAWSAVMANSTSSLIGALAKRIGERVRGRPEEWLRYLEFLDRHLKSGAINMRVLKLQVDWMERYQPREPIGKKHELVWMTAKLALANHEGRLDGRNLGAERRRFDELCNELFEEEAPLVCDATLNLAVAYTNAFEFEMAFAVLDSLLARDRAVVGTSAYGKLLSSRGQHYAFLGMEDEAVAAFKEALACFARLSDEKQRAINTDITRAYLTTVMIDHDRAAALPQLKEYLTGRAEASDEELKATIHELATGLGSKFHHHVLLRYLVDGDYSDVCRQVYRAFKDEWSLPGGGHPWEMIEFYRAIISSSPHEALRHLENAYKIAKEEGGETILVIAAVIAGAALAEKGPDVWSWQRRFAELMDAIKDISGLQGTERWQILEAQPAAKLTALELAKKVLPFNFR